MTRLLATLVALLVCASAQAATAFYTAERVSGLNKICIYTYLGSDFAITIRATDICPLSIEVDPND